MDLINFDKFTDFENEVIKKLDTSANNNNIFSKKIIIKKILDFFNPIIDEKDRLDSIHKLDKKKIIIDKSQITLNYKISSKYINKKISTLDLKNYIIPILNHFNILGIYNDKLHYNVPYKLNEFSLELNNTFNKISTYNTNIFIKSLKYSNKVLFSLESVNINDLIKLYKYILIQFELYTNNKDIIINKKQNLNTYIINNDIDNDNDEFITLFNKNTEMQSSSKKNIDIDKCNLFLTHKIGNHFSNNIYNSFNNDDLLNLYENIYLYSLDNDKIQNIIKNILNQKEYQKEYQKNLLILENKILLNNKLEYIAKKKFPNLFNINSPENLFNKFNNFDVNKIPKKIKEVIILDLKKNEDILKIIYIINVNIKMF